MAHDPVSLLKQNQYYIDSMIFIIPRGYGKYVGFENIQTIPEGGYPFIKGGITFNSDSLMIDLYFRDKDHDKNYSLLWNGNYVVKWK